MKKTYKLIKVFAALLSLATINTNAQNCINTTQYPSGTVAIASTGTTTVTTCNFAGEYSVLNFTAAGAYNFNSTGVGNYLTVTDNLNNPLGAGYALLGVVIPSVGVYRCHISLSPTCGTNATCHNVTVSSATFCNSASQYPTGTVNIANTGTTTVTTCNFGGEYSVNNFSATGVYTINATGGAGNYFTVKNTAGTIIYAQGLSPLTLNIAYTGLYRIHIAVAGPTACTTDGVCHTVNVVAPAAVGCTGTPAAANAVATPTAICAGANSTLSLSTTYTASGIAYQWFSASAFAGPYTAVAGATVSNYPSIALTTNTFYTAVITCTNSASSATATAVQVIVNPNPTVSIAATSTAICSSGTSTVALTASGAPAYTWSPAGSLSASTGSLVTATPTITTIYSVVGSNTTGCTNTKTISISVSATPSLTVNSASVCANNSVALNVSAPSFTYCQPAYSTGTGSGDYIGGVQLANITNTTTGLATPYYTVYPNTGNTTTTLTAGSTYTLFLNPGTFSSNNGMAAWIDYNKNGTLNDVNEKLGEVTIAGAYPTFSVVVFTVPATAFNGVTRFRVREVYATTNIDPCLSATYGETEDYIITIVGGATQYSWTPATYLSTTTGSTVVSTPATSINYTVTTSVNGCTSSATSTVVVNTPSLSITGNSTTCTGQSIALTANGASTYTWNTGATTVSISATPTANATYTASGTSSLGCVGSATQAVTVNPLPTVNAVSNTSLLCSGSSATLTANGASTYTWNTSANTAVIVINPTVTTTYTVNGTSVAGCNNVATLTQSVSVCTGLNNVSAKISGLSVYPNPSNGEFTVELNNGINKTIQVTDIAGRVVLTTTSLNDKVNVNINNLTNGIYFVKIVSNNVTEVIKVVKQ